MDVKNIGTDESKAPFNMAIDTLRRIGVILQEIGIVASDATLSPEERQSILVQKVKHFFFQSSPLLSQLVVDKYQDRVSKLQSKTITVAITRYGVIKKKQTRLLYDAAIDLELNKLLLEIQRELQIEKYFMPPKKDLSRAVTEM